MTDRNRPYDYDFDSNWDVEQAVHQKQERYRSAMEPERRSPRPRRLPHEPSPPTPRRRPPQKRRRPRQRVNGRGLALLIALALAALAILVGFIALLVSAFSEDEPALPNTAIVDGDYSTPSLPAEELTPLMQLVARADTVAAGYDYDGAVDVLREYGTDWEQQPELTAARDRYQAAKAQTVLWEDPSAIPQIAFHSLIVDPDRAFSSENASGYAQNMVTVTEFRSILEQLYANGYVLVSFHDITRYGVNNDGDQAYLNGSIYLPAGKKPLVLAQDDVNYYEYMVDGDGDRYADAAGDGFASRLVIDESGAIVCEYYTADGQLLTGAYDLIPILEEFIQEHPDFSYQGARAVIAVTGYQGVFGYRTHPEWELILGEESYNQEVTAARDVAKRLKELGWEIASHGFGHYAYDTLGTEEIESDIRKWENQVQPIVGDSDIFVFLYGSDLCSTESEYSGEIYRLLYDAGYRFFAHSGDYNPWAQLTTEYVRQTRRMIDGETLWYHPETLSDLFDATLITDPARPATQLPK